MIIMVPKGIRWFCCITCYFVLMLRPGTAEHASQCFSRLVRALMGDDAVADSKVERGKKLVILGVLIEITDEGFACKPSPDKVVKWLDTIRTALREDRQCPGDAGKLAGKLSWGASALFSRMGRAMLRPLFDQQSRRDGVVSSEWRHAMRWWEGILKQQICEERLWQSLEEKPLHLFCDARGSPPNLAAVLLSEDFCVWTHMKPATETLGHFRARGDNQIMGLELLSIALGLNTFMRFLRGHKVVIHSDNTGSEVSHRCVSCGQE